MNKNISLLEYNSLIWFIVRATYIGLSISNLIMTSKNSSPISGLVALILSIFPLFIFYKLRSFDKSKNICDLNKYAFGKINKIINTILVLGAFMFVLIVFIELIYFINSQFLYKTNIVFISTIFIIPIIYSLLKGLSTISKTSLILFYIVVATVIFITIGVSSSIDINNLNPLFYTNISNLLHGSLIIIAYNVLPLFFLLIIKENQITNNNPFKSLFFFTISLLTLINATILTIGSFGINMSLLYEYPEFQILKKVKIGEFLGRLESILSLEWVIALFILIIMGLLFITENIKQSFKLKEKTNKIITIIVCLILLILSNMSFASKLINSHFLNSTALIIMFIVFLGLPSITLLIIYLKRRHDQYRPCYNGYDQQKDY